MSVCQGCGDALPPPPRACGRRRQWCSESCRKRYSYCGTCVDCGAPTAYSGQARASERCYACAGAARRVWTPDVIVASIRRWADEHGGVPPTASDWRARDGSYHPPSSVVIEMMGWANAIRAAGFDAFTTGHYGRDGEDPEVVKETAALYRSGLSLVEVGDRLDVTPQAIVYRLRRAGVPLRRCGDYRSAA